jgi:tetratricopeptide (TPR) repeat protein
VRSLRPALLALVAGGLALGRSAGQEPPPLQDPATFKRPSLSGNADSSDWEAYFDYGVARLRNDPRGAERAFYWASRLDPSRAEPLYGRWVAYWMRVPGWFEEYVEERPRVLESPRVLQVDSLYLRALFRNPLMPRTLTVLLFDQLPGRWGTDRISTALVEYGANRFDAAAADFGNLVRGDAKHYRLRYWLALCFTAVKRYDSAAAEVTALLEEMRRRDERQLAYTYQSKELLDYSLGLLELARGNRTAARDALQQALVENLAFYPAHSTLAELALSQGDREAAWREYALAVDVGASDGVLHYRYGAALGLAGRYQEAEAQLRKAVELEPWYAPSYMTLARVLEAQGKRQQALEQYRAYVVRALRSAPELDQAQARIAVLAAQQPDSSHHR